MPLEYFGIRVTDLQRSIRFYTKTLGLREIRRGKMSHGGIWVMLQDPETHQRLELNWYPKGHKFDTPYDPGEGLDHIGFKVNDARAMCEKLLSIGFESALEPWIEEGRTIVGYVKDPDGNWIEFYSPLKER